MGHAFQSCALEHPDESMASNMAANTNHTTLLKNQSAIKYLP